MKLCAVEVSTAGKICFTPYFVTQSTNFWKSYLFRLVIVHTSQLPLKLKLYPWFKKGLKNNHPESSQDHCTVTRLASKMQQCIRLRLHGHTKSCVKISTWRFIMEWMNEWTNVLWGGCRWAQTSQTSQPADKRQPTCSAAASRPCRRRWSQSHADHWLESPFPNLWRKKEKAISHTTIRWVLPLKSD